MYNIKTYAEQLQAVIGPIKAENKITNTFLFNVMKVFIVLRKFFFSFCSCARLSQEEINTSIIDLTRQNKKIRKNEKKGKENINIEITFYLLFTLFTWIKKNVLFRNPLKIFFL